GTGWVGDGDDRRLAIDCRSRLYILTPWWVYRFLNTTQPTASCGRLDDRVIFGGPVLGFKGSGAGKSSRVQVPVVCGQGSSSCVGKATVNLRPKIPCPRCDLTVAKNFKL